MEIYHLDYNQRHLTLTKVEEVKLLLMTLIVIQTITLKSVHYT